MGESPDQECTACDDLRRRVRELEGRLEATLAAHDSYVRSCP